jgi:hypothetical protein
MKKQVLGSLKKRLLMASAAFMGFSAATPYSGLYVDSIINLEVDSLNFVSRSRQYF